MIVTSEFAKRVLPLAIERELERLGWSRADLSRRTGITPQTIGNICNGLHEPKASILKTIADALGVTTDQMLCEPREKTSRKLQTVA